MRSTFRVLFYVNRSKEKNGVVPIMGRITINGTVAQFSCKQTVPLHLWNVETHSAKGRGRTARQVNDVLMDIRTKILLHYRRMTDREAYVSADMVRDAFQGIGAGYETLLASFDRELELFRRRVNRDRAPSSYRSLQVVRKHLAAFIRKQYHRNDLLLRELTEAFIRNFCIYLCSDLGLSKTTAWIYTTPLKRIVSQAYTEGRIARNPFAQFRIAPQVKERKFLTEAELQGLIAHRFDDPALAFTRDIFVFGCLTGISFIDIKQLTIDQVVELNGQLWIVARRQKTNTPFQVKLLEIPCQILRRYAAEGDGVHLFNRYDYWKVNELLKRVALACGIRTHLTFHQSRHTFATLALSKGMPIESVSRILGHTKIATTQIYAKLTTEKLDKDLTLLGNELDKGLKGYRP